MPSSGTYTSGAPWSERGACIGFLGRNDGISRIERTEAAFAYPNRHVACGFWYADVPTRDRRFRVGADTTGNLLEIGVIDSGDGPIIVHAMAARPKYLR